MDTLKLESMLSADIIKIGQTVLQLMSNTSLRIHLQNWRTEDIMIVNMHTNNLPEELRENIRICSKEKSMVYANHDSFHYILGDAITDVKTTRVRKMFNIRVERYILRFTVMAEILAEDAYVVFKRSDPNDSSDIAEPPTLLAPTQAIAKAIQDAGCKIEEGPTRGNSIGDYEVRIDALLGKDGFIVGETRTKIEKSLHLHYPLARVSSGVNGWIGIDMHRVMTEE